MISAKLGVRVPSAHLHGFSQWPVWNRASRTVERDQTVAPRSLLVDKAVRTVFMLYEQFGIAAGVAHPVLGQEVRVRPLTPPRTCPSHVGGSKPLANFPGAHGTADIVDEAPSCWSLGRHQFNAPFSAFRALNDTPHDGPMAMRSPVRGLRPSRAGRSVRANLPKPATATSSPRASASASRCEDGPDRRFGPLLRNPRLVGNTLDDLPPLHSLNSPVSRAVAGAARAPPPNP